MADFNNAVFLRFVNISFTSLSSKRFLICIWYRIFFLCVKIQISKSLSSLSQFVFGFYNIVRRVQGSRPTGIKILESKRQCSRRYVGKVTVTPRYKQFNIVVIWNAFTFVSIPHSWGSWEEALQVELRSQHEWKTNWMSLVLYNVHDIVCLSHVVLNSWNIVLLCMEIKEWESSVVSSVGNRL